MNTYKRNSIRVVQSLVILACVLISACAKTILLKPALVGQDCKSDSDWNATACLTGCLQPIGDASYCSAPGKSNDLGNPPVSVAAGSVRTWQSNVIRVGWEDYYDPGTQPCACWGWSSYMIHGYVKFDISPLEGKKISSANLAWKKSTAKSGEGDTVSTNLPRHVSCVKWLLQATGPWKADATPGKVLYSDLDQDRYPNTQYVESKSVVNVVKKWISTDQNHGFMLTPRRNRTEKESNHSCLNSLHNFELFVRYRD